MSELRRRRRVRQRRTRRRRNNLLLILGGVLAALVGGTVLVSALAVDAATSALCETGVKEIRLGQNTRIYDRNGKELGVIAGETNRTVVGTKRIPQVLKDATVAIEDKRFYDHDGVDYYRLVGAAVRDIQTRSARQGGSTITMQLAKNLYEPTADRTISQKIEEACLAFQYEKKYSKDEILTRYLNGVFYGQNAIGVQAASLTYFDRDVADISLPQAALLAGLPQAPTSYNPFANPEDAKARRNLVLGQMAQQGYIDADQAERAKRSGLALKRGRAYQARREEYFFEYVRQQLIDIYGEDEVVRGGFKVYTTVDPVLQTAARAAIQDHLYYDDDPEAAVVMLDSRKGYIRAMASSQTFSADSQFNLATQARRQSGSTFKTFVLTEAIRRGINPYTTLYGSKKLEIVDDPKYGSFTTETYSRSYRGAVPIASATLSSDNSVYMQMTLDLTPPKVIDLAYRMGIPEQRELPDVPSIGLGAGLVTPLDMADAYAPLSNGGFRVEPLAIQRVVKPNGETDVFAPERTRVFSDGVAYEVTRILQNNITGGTGGNARLTVPAAGKTGTTDDFRDAWFVGYTPEYSTAVWVGYPNASGATRFMTSVHGIAVSGGSFPALIWGDFMQAVVDRLGESGSFPLPRNPVEWSPFSSDFTRAAGEANSSESESESEASTDETESVPASAPTGPGQPPPPTTVVTPPPTTVAPTPPPTPPPATTITPPPATPPPTVTPEPPPPPPTTPPPPPPTTP